MKKTINVNIGGFIFHLDEDAYERTQQYLQTLRNYFRSSEGHEEIMQDIETRMAEIFKERLAGQREVINMADVDHMTLIMGKPEEYLDGEPAASGVKEEEVYKGPKRLFRDPDNHVIGGVCGGLGAYFGIDPVIFRVIFCVAFFGWGSGMLVYIILWIAMPKARTTSEKLQMKGERITVSNIEKSVKEELNDVKQNLGSAKDKAGFRKTGQDVANGMSQVFTGLFKALGKTMGIAAMIFGIIFLILLVRGTFNHSAVTIHNNDRLVTFSAWDGLTMLFDNPTDRVLSLFALAVLAFVPLTLLVYGGIKLLFNIRHNARWMIITSSILWFAALVLASYEGVKLLEQFSNKEKYVSEQPIAIQPWQTLMLKADEPADLKTGKQIPLEDVEFDIRKNDKDSTTRLEITRYARGKTWEEADLNARKISYQVIQTDTTLTLQPELLLSYGERFRGQHVKLVLRIPDGQKVHLHKSLHPVIYDIDNIYNMHDYDMLGKTWMMTSEGLICMTCTQAELDKARERSNGNNDEDLDDADDGKDDRHHHNHNHDHNGENRPARSEE